MATKPLNPNNKHEFRQRYSSTNLFQNDNSPVALPDEKPQPKMPRNNSSTKKQQIKIRQNIHNQAFNGQKVYFKDN